MGYQDECWWSRLCQPHLHSWAEADQPLQLVEKEADKADPEPKAVCCYGLLRSDTHKMLVRFVEGQAVSALTIAYLEWLGGELAKEGHKTLVMVWDNASWHKSQLVTNYLKNHNQQVRAGWREGKAGVRIIPCFLPVKSPWLNSIEPKWLHGKRAVVEPEGKLAMQELTGRVSQYYECELLPFLTK